MFSRTVSSANQSVGLAVLRAERDLVRHRGPRSPQRDRLAVDRDAIRWSAWSAPNSSRATSVRPEPSSPARPTTSPSRMVRLNGAIAAGPTELVGLQQRCRSSAPAAVLLEPLELGQVLADHLRDQLDLRRARRSGTRRHAARCAAPSSGRRSRTPGRGSARRTGSRRRRSLQLPHHAEQLRDLVGVQAGGGLVEDQHPGLDVDRPGDRDHLLDRQRVVADSGAVDVQVELQRGEQLGRARRRIARQLDPAEPARLPADEDVLRDREVRAAGSPPGRRC